MFFWPAYDVMNVRIVIILRSCSWCGLRGGIVTVTILIAQEIRMEMQTKYIRFWLPQPQPQHHLQFRIRWKMSTQNYDLTSSCTSAWFGISQGIRIRIMDGASSSLNNLTSNWRRDVVNKLNVNANGYGDWSSWARPLIAWQWDRRKKQKVCFVGDSQTRALYNGA